MNVMEKGIWNVRVVCKKRHALGEDPYEIIVEEGNLLLTAGITRMLNLLGGLGGNAYSATRARIGVGTGQTAVTIGDTDLAAPAGASYRWFRPVDSGYPTVDANVITWKATWGDSEGNFSWQEWGIDCGGPSASAVLGTPLLNRKVVNLGAKTGGIWSLTVSVTIT